MSCWMARKHCNGKEPSRSLLVCLNIGNFDIQRCSAPSPTQKLQCSFKNTGLNSIIPHVIYWFRWSQQPQWDVMCIISSKRWTINHENCIKFDLKGFFNSYENNTTRRYNLSNRLEWPNRIVDGDFRAEAEILHRSQVNFWILIAYFAQTIFIYLFNVHNTEHQHSFLSIWSVRTYTHGPANWEIQSVCMKPIRIN